MPEYATCCLKQESPMMGRCLDLGDDVNTAVSEPRIVLSAAAFTLFSPAGRPKDL